MKGATMDLESRVIGVGYADPASAAKYFSELLSFETDCADVWKDIEEGLDSFVIVDCRAEQSYEKAHLPGAISLPWARIDEECVKALPDRPIVTYCWGPSCNASTKGAARLTALGFQVKQMIGGLEYWIREGHPTEGRRPALRGNERPSDWGMIA
jgi:rhodanese-related sulfurtransferase